jgi:ribonuclease HII
MPDTSLEIAAGAPLRRIAGIDEVGRGPLAGPVVAAAVVLPAEGLPPDLAAAIDDSKALKPGIREALLPEIVARCAVGIGRASVEEIDRINILRATYLAMCRALENLPFRPDLALIDGNRIPEGLSCPGQCVVGGDGRSLSIAAASIVAKVTRDREMADLALRYPGYGWERNAGYGTAEHRAALLRLGPTPEHRKSFAPVAEQLALSL